MTNIDPYPISALQDRYRLSSRQAVYDRINKLGIQPASRGKISSDQLDKLDRLDNWIKVGKTIENFISSERLAAVTNEPGAAIVMPTPKSQDLPTSLHTFEANSTSLIQLVYEIAAALGPQVDPLQHLECLERAASQDWLLTTGEVKQLIGVKPYVNGSDRFTRGSFAFVKSGKIGSCIAWRVVKVQ